MLGAEAYVKYVNDELGGVKMANGKTYKLDFKWMDDGYNTGRAVSNVKQLITNYHPAAFVELFGSSVSKATIDLLDQSNVPNLYSVQGNDFWYDTIAKHPMMGPVGEPSNTLWVLSELNYIKSKWPGAKLAVLLQNDTYGQDIEKVLKKQVPGSGLKIVATQNYNAGAPTVSTQIAKLAHSGADVFLDFSITPTLVAGMKYAATIGWKVPHFVCYNCANGSITGPSGKAADKLYAPLVVVDPSSPQWSNLEGVVKLKQILAKYGSKQAAGTSDPALVGAGAIQLVVENLEKSQPNAASLIKTVRNQDGTPQPLLIPGTKVTTAPDYPYYVNQLTMAQYSQATNHWTLVAKPFVDPRFSR